VLGHGGIATVARAAKVSRSMVTDGMRELEQGPLEAFTRIRREGGGRKRVEETDPQMLAALDRVISPDTRGDPESPLRWTCKSSASSLAAFDSRFDSRFLVGVATLTR